jgi:integrase
MTTKKTTTTARRRRGEGSIGRYHNHPTCPPIGEDGTRPDHTCQGPYRAQVWVVDTKGSRTRKVVYGKTEAEVVRKVTDLNVASATGKVVTGSVTLAQWLDPKAEEKGLENWWTVAAPGLKLNSRIAYERSIRLYLVPALGKYRLDRLTPEHVEAMYRSMRSLNLSEATILHAHNVLRRSLAVAVRKGKVVRNVADLTDNRPSVADRAPTKALTVEEGWKVLRLAGDNPRFWLALMTGLRQGEVLGLRWRDVVLDVPDGELPYVVVRETVVREPGVGLVTQTPKSDASTDRAVPLVPMVSARLKVHHAAAVSKGWADPEDYVFPSPRNPRTPRDPKNDRSQWAALVSLAGLDHVTLHSARNTTSQLLENAGVPERVVAEILGHANVWMTRKYQSGNTVAKQQAAQSLARYLSESMPPELEGPAA